MKKIFALSALLILCYNLSFSSNLLWTDSLENQSTRRLTEEPSSGKQADISRFKPYAHNLSFGIRVSHWNQSESSQLALDRVSYLNLAEYHFMIGTQFEYNLTEKFSLFIEADAIIIPREEKLQGVRWRIGEGVDIGSGNGGLVIPYGLGARYAWQYKRFRPFVLSTIGATYLHIGYGNIAINLDDFFDMSITERKKHVFQYSFGGGCDYRFLPMFSLRGAINYRLSSPISPPMGSINAFQGLSLSMGLVFIAGKR